jgi:hypothetical protein
MRLMKRFVNVADANPNVTDAATVRLQQLKASVADANPDVTDAVTMRLDLLKASVADVNLDVTDAVTIEVKRPLLSVNVADSIGLTDDVTAQLPVAALEINVADTLTVTDSITTELKQAGWQQTGGKLKPARGIMPNLTHPLARGHVGCWPMNEGVGGQIADLSGYRNHLSFAGVWSQGGAYVNDPSHRLLADGPVLSQSEGTFIFKIARQQATDNYAPWVNIDNSSNNSTHEMLLGYPATGADVRSYPNFDQDSADFWVHSSGDIDDYLPLYEYHIIAIVWKNGERLEGYLDGVLDGSLFGDKSWTASDWVSGERFCMGATYGIEYSTRAIYQWAHAYNRALSAADIVALSREPFQMFDYDYVLPKHYGAELILDVNVADANPNVTDAVTIQRTAGAALEINVADSIGLTDTAAAQLDILKPSVADTLTVTDAVIARLDLLKINVSDNVGLTDAVTVEIPAVGALSVNVADTVSLTDSIIARLDLLKVSIADALTLTDAVTARLDLLKIDTSDSLTVAESAQLSLSPLKVSVGDAVGVSEGLTVSTTPLKVDVADTLGLSDSVAATIVAQALAIDVADAIGLTDSVAAAIAIYPMLQAFLSVKATESSLSVYATESELSVAR